MTWLTPARAAIEADRAKSTIYEALERGELHGHQRVRGGRWQIHPDVIGAWIRGTDQREACGCPRVALIRRSA